MPDDPARDRDWPAIGLESIEPRDSARSFRRIFPWRGHMAGYMQALDGDPGQPARLPGSTLVIVSRFTRSEFKVEVELWAARGDEG